MTFELTIHGDFPADLLTALQQLHVPDALHAPQEAAEAPAKPKTTRRKENPKCTTVTAPAPNADAAAATTVSPAAPEPAATPTTSESGAAANSSTPTASLQSSKSDPAVHADTSDAPTSAQPGTTGDPPAATATTATTASSDAAAMDKLRDLSRSLIVQGRSAEVRAAVAAAGAKNISSIPPERYTEVWEKLLQLKDEVDKDAAD